MRKETYTIDGVTFTRVTKTVARNLFNNGEIVGICPVNINPESIWDGMCEFKKGCRGDWSFDALSNSFTYYNCQLNETGRYPKFFKVVL
jgi:hypothetical protein